MKMSEFVQGIFYNIGPSVKRDIISDLGGWSRFKDVAFDTKQLGGMSSFQGSKLFFEKHRLTILEVITKDAALQSKDVFEYIRSIVPCSGCDVEIDGVFNSGRDTEINGVLISVAMFHEYGSDPFVKPIQDAMCHYVFKIVLDHYIFLIERNKKRLTIAK